MSRPLFPVYETINGEARMLEHPALKLTDAERTAGVTPVNFAYPPGDVRRYGLKVDGTSDMAAINAAHLVAIAQGGGVLRFPAGNIGIDGDIAPPRYVHWRGVGENTIFRALSSSCVLHLSSANGDNVLSDFTLVGSVPTAGMYVGTGIQIGDTGYTGYNTLQRLYIYNFETGVRLAGSLWGTLELCRIQFNRIGVDFNAGSAGITSNATTITECTIAFNERNGIGATNTPVRGIGLIVSGGSIESNCTAAPGTYPQVALGAMAHVHFDAVYAEYSPVGTKPIAYDLSNSGQITFTQPYINGSSTGLYSSSNGCSFVMVKGGRILQTSTRCIDLPSCVDVTIDKIEQDLATTNNVITGARSTENTTKWAQQKVEDVAWTPTLIGSTNAGPPAYTVQVAYYNQIGNQVFIRGRVAINGKGTIAGNVQIGGLPIPVSANADGHALINIVAVGVTPLAGYTMNVGVILPGSQLLELFQDGNVAGVAALPVANIATATTFRFSGFYTV